MSLPVSQYEELLAEVRGLRRKAQRVQQLAQPLLSESSSSYRNCGLGTGSLQNSITCQPYDYTMESVLGHHDSNTPLNYESAAAASSCDDEDEYEAVRGNSSTKLSVSSEPVMHRTRASSLYQGTWPVEKNTMWNSEPIGLASAGKPEGSKISTNASNQMEMNSVISFTSSSGGMPLDRVLASPEPSKWSSQQLEAKMDVVHSLLAMLGAQEHVDMGETLLALSACPKSCLAMRQSGCIPLLVQLIQSDKDADTRKKASQALKNLVDSQLDEKTRKRESRVLKLLEQCRAYLESLRRNESCDEASSSVEGTDKHPVQTVGHIMKLSFDEGHRQAICQLGGIHAIASLVEAEHSLHGSTSTSTTATTELPCILMRRYACMALTNLTFGDSGNKALLCSFREFMRALVLQLQSPSDELRQVTASVLRNLSWRADPTSKEVLREVGSVSGLMKAAMLDSKENTLKSILSALWNLSAHCTENKSEICAVEGALGFLVDMLTYKTPSKSLAIIENSGGILRNISSQIAVREDYREILRNHNCLRILLDQLKSPSLTIVSNACGTLWNLSAKCAVDQEILWQMGAPSMLRSLNHSKHKMIAMGSSAALKNLLGAMPKRELSPRLDSTALALDLPVLPTLGVRKQKALLRDLDQNLSETYDNIEKDSPTKKDLVSNFSSLNISVDSFRSSTQSFSSLPFVSSAGKQNYGGIRNKFSDCEYEEEEIEVTDDQPIDFSKKYSETKVTVETREKNDYLFEKDRGEKVEAFGIYAETDLDQPTDYSLRYAEHDSDSELCTKQQSYLQDTVKTYCTEDTPYETTPFNFSTATSMSDLRGDDKQATIDNDKIKETASTSKEKNESVEEKEHCSTEDISEVDIGAQAVEKPEKSQFSSGLTSPEKPVNYCEEGTPGYFSRVSSFGSLNSIPVEEKDKKKCPKRLEKISPKVANEAKAVKFERVVNYAEETPLMFSRSSSLASLDSIEQHSIHDDRSSVISDFSRLTSGIVSPSELPDSPTQTVPPSPKPRKTPEFPRAKASAKSIPKPSVFEDNITKFKEESTPVQFSTATSLSSLTIDEHEDVASQQRESGVAEAKGEVCDVKKEERDEKKDAEKRGSTVEVKDEFVVESEDEGDADILEACINMGMQTNRHNKSSVSEKSFKYDGKPHSTKTLLQPAPDTLRTYCTEDTPADLSHAGSQSDLSLLSGLDSSKEAKGRRKDYLSDDSSNLSGDNNNILAECIRSGMPKSKKDVPPSCIPRKTSQDVCSKKFNPNPRDSDSNHVDEANKMSTSLNGRKVTSVSKREQSLPPYLSPKDEVEKYAVENSPYQFSSRSSLSDLTVDSGSVAGLKRTSRSVSQSQCSSTTDQYSAGTVLKTGSSQDQRLSRQESLSSISVESLSSLEAERALLEQCISSGKPKSNPQAESRVFANEESDSKNLNAASVAGYEITRTIGAEEGWRVAGVEVAGEGDVGAVEPMAEGRLKGSQDPTRNHRPEIAQQEKQSPAEGFVTLDRQNSGSSKSSGDSPKILDNMGIDDSLTRSCDDSQSVDNRMLDPDAMIESLDRFTAELVSQASHLTKDEDKYKMSTGDNTWNDDTSPNEITFPSISGSVPNVITFSHNSSITSNKLLEDIDLVDAPPPSGDFSSLTTSTMTDSTLIAMEATKIAAAIKYEAEMFSSMNGLELDQIQPPSQMNSLTNSEIRSPKLVRRKRSLPAGLMVRRALSNSLNTGSSLESLSNLDHVNPPSDMEGSMTSIASLPHENESRIDMEHPIFQIKQQFYCGELENINPPSLFDEITDFCSSLADVPTESTIFQDCQSDEITACSEDYSSVESTPKKTPSKIKQRRSQAKDRYKTYVVDPEVLTKSDEFKSVREEVVPGKLTPKQRRERDRSRFQTQVIGEAVTNLLQQPKIESPSESQRFESCQSSSQSPVRTKTTIRRSFVQKRLENRDRFKTQTLSEAAFLPPENIDQSVENGADTVLRRLQDTQDELLDCETLSLVSNDEDSEHNSGGSINYRTYHRSWGARRKEVLVIRGDEEIGGEVESEDVEGAEEEVEDEGAKVAGKPKIVKPSESTSAQEPSKGIRGRRKPLYCRTSISSRIPPKSGIATKTSVNGSVAGKSGEKSKPNSSVKISPVRTPTRKQSPANAVQSSSGKGVPQLERQGTFTKDESPQQPSGVARKPPTKIPTPRTIASKIPTNNNNKPPGLKSRIVKSTSSDRANKNMRVYNRSTSADSRETATGRMQQSPSSQSLKSGTVKKSSIPSLAQRSTSNLSINSNGGTSTKKQVTSKIASLWKKIEDSKRQPPKKDTRVWIEPESPRMIRSNTFNSKDGVAVSESSASRSSSFLLEEGAGQNGV